MPLISLKFANYIPLDHLLNLVKYNLAISAIHIGLIKGFIYL